MVEVLSVRMLFVLFLAYHMYTLSSVLGIFPSLFLNRKLVGVYSGKEGAGSEVQLITILLFLSALCIDL